MAVRIPIGLTLALLLASSSIAIAIGALLLFRPDWLGLAPPRNTDTSEQALDTVPAVSPWDELYEQLGHYTALVAQLQDSLHRARHIADSLQSDLHRMRDELLRWQRESQRQYDSLRLAHYQAFAKIYNNASPEDVAQVLVHLSPTDVGLLLRLMSPRQAARVIAALPPEQAAAVLLQTASPQR